MRRTYQTARDIQHEEYREEVARMARAIGTRERRPRRTPFRDLRVVNGQLIEYK